MSNPALIVLSVLLSTPLSASDTSFNEGWSFWPEGALEAVSIYPGERISSSLDSPVGRLKLDASVEEYGKLLFIPVSVIGENGALESNADVPVTVDVIGGTLLGFGSARPASEEDYLGNVATTYYGKAMAVVRKEDDSCAVTFSAPGLETKTITFFLND